MPEILENIFGSRSQLRLMRFFVLNPNKKLSISELRDRLHIDGRTILSDIRMFSKIGFVKQISRKKQKQYAFNENFPYYTEFRNLFIKSNTYPQCKELSTLKKIGRVKLIIVGGIFVNYAKARLDVLIVVDDMSRSKLKNSISMIEAEIGKEVRYMAINSEEFNYRLDMMDRFIIELLSSPHDILLNKVPKLKGFIINLKK
ncbi:MAG: hypothetical protein KAT32_04870 [Candidatus Moranbacteria bacterium]|nr:hypothetical protein [Candidatus Moranbacteria bacterium]